MDLINICEDIIIGSFEEALNNIYYEYALTHKRKLMISTVGWFQEYHPHGKHALHANIYILASLFRRGGGANITHMSATSQHLLHKRRRCRAILLHADAYRSNTFIKQCQQNAINFDHSC